MLKYTWRLIVALLLWGTASVVHAFTIERTSATNFHLGTADSVSGNYVAYRITNDGASQPAVWVTINNFAGGVVSLATHEDGKVFLGSMGNNEEKMAYFYLQASAETTTPQTHYVSVHTSEPPSAAAYSKQFSLGVVVDEIRALANKPSVVISTPNPPYLGGVVTVTFTGATGTLGSSQDLYFTAASLMSWRASAFRLYRATINFTGGNTATFNDQLFFTLPNSADSNYEAIYEFRILDMTADPTPAAPSAFIRSGQKLKYSLPDPTEIPPIQPPLNSMLVGKSVNTNQLSNGGTVTYSLSISNSSVHDVQVQTISDTLPSLPAAATYISSSSEYSGVGIGDPTVSSSTLVWFGPFTVPARSTRVLTFRAFLPDTDGAYTNRAVANVGNVQIDATQDTDQNTPAIAVTLVGEIAADIGVGKSGPPSVGAGSNVIYTVSVTNAGPFDATSIVVTDALPENVRFVSASGNGTENGRVVTWSIPSLAGGIGTNFFVEVTAFTSGILTNFASAGSAVTDPNTSNNSTNVITVIAESADIALFKSGPEAVSAMSNLIYTVAVTNFGPSAATSVVVTDSLPRTVTFLSASSGGTENDRVVTWTIPSLAVGAGNTFEVRVRAPASGILTNFASVGSAISDPAAANNSTNVITWVTEGADLSVIKQGPAQAYGGSNVKYTIAVSNAGPSAAISMVVTDTLPQDVTFVSAEGGGSENPIGVVTWSLPTLAAGAVTNLSVTVTTPYTGVLTNVAVAGSATADPDLANNDGSTAHARVVTLLNGINASGFVYGDVNQSSSRDGSEAGTGPGLFVKFVGLVTNAVSVDALSGGYSVSNLPPGTYSVLVSTNSSLTDLSPSAPAGWVGTEIPSLLLTDVVLGEGPLRKLEFGLFAPPAAGTPLFIEKTASVKEAEIGDSVTYSVKIRNVSSNLVAGITLQDVLPAGFAYQLGSAKLDGLALADPVGGQGARLAFSVGTLAPNVTATLTYRVQIGVGALHGTGQNRAQAVAPGQPPLASNMAIATVRINPGVFTDRAILAGKVFVDQNENKIQDDGEPGVPGVRLYIQDGSYVVTDSEGKYNIYGLSPRTHIVKVDEITLPKGAQLEQLTPRHDRRGATCLADLKRGELRKVNFAIKAPTQAVQTDVQQRRQKREVNTAEIQQTIRRDLSSGPLPQAGREPTKAGVEQPAIAPFESLAETPAQNGNTSALPPRPVRGGDSRIGLGQIKVVLPEREQPADGQTPATIRVLVEDEKGQPVTSRTRVTLESSLGRWQVEDADRKEPGIQVYLEKGSGEFVLLPPQEPGEALILVSSGRMQSRTQLAFVPALRPLMAVGVVEGHLNLHKLDLKHLLVSRQSDGFEQELRNWTFSGGSGHLDGGGRAAMFLKGKVKGDYLLTLAYDSDKETQQRMFRDIEPDKYYPVYGDSAVRGFEAQSTSRLYVRVDNKRCYLLYGDYATGSRSPARGLGDYNRALTGIKQHYEKSNVVVNVWAAYDNTRQVIREFRADGTSGPYFFNGSGILENSEKVEILTRDRSQPSLILRSTTLVRFTDYEFEPFAGRLLFRAPVPSLDENLNPISIRVTYESDDGGAKFWVYGADGQLKLHPRLELGGAVVRDENPANEYQLQSANATLKLTDRTFLLAEVAQSHSTTNGTGTGGRLELRHDSAELALRLWGAYLEPAFDNASSPIAAGRQEVGGKLIKPLTRQTRLVLEAIDTRDLENDGERWGVLGGLDHLFDRNIRLELGGRYSHENGAAASASTVGVAPNEVISVRAKVTAPVPYVPKASVYGEAENDVVHTDRRLLAMGASYQIEERTRMYARHEFIDALGGPFELNSSQEKNTTVFGVETEYMRDGHLFNEYRARDSFNGRDAEAAIGLRNGWNLAEGLRLNTSFERVSPIYGTNELNRATAVALGVEYLGATDWKASGRVEMRHSEETDHWLSTLGYARKLSLDWTVLAKSILLTEDNKANRGDRFQSRLQLGLAWRQTQTDIWNSLFLYEYKYERDELASPSLLDRHVHILSTHLNYHPLPKWTVSGRYAMKVTEDEATPDYYMAHLVGGRVMYDLTDRWSVGLNGSVMFDSDFSSKQYGLGPDVGFRMHDNLWVDVGYNVIGFHDRDLSGANYTDQGFHLGIRMQFDEHILDGFAKKK